MQTHKLSHIFNIDNMSFSLLLLGSISACTAAPGENRDVMLAGGNIVPIMPEIVYSGSQCNLSNQAMVSWIQKPSELEKRLKQVNRHRLNATIKLPAVNFISEGILLVTMGQKMSGGYGLSLRQEPIKVQQGIASLVVNWQKPGKGMMVIQMLTSPCIFIKIRKQNYQKLRVITQTGRQIGEVNID